MNFRKQNNYRCASALKEEKSTMQMEDIIPSLYAYSFHAKGVEKFNLG